MPLTIVQTRDDLLCKLGYPDPSLADNVAKQDVCNAINWAYQMLWRAGGVDYFTREEISLTLVAGTSEYLLDTNVQAVIGPVITKARKNLMRLDSRNQVDDFGLIFLGQSTRTLANGAPVAFYVEDNRAAATDLHKTRFFVVPAPDSTAVTAHSPLLIDGVRECPSYVIADLTSTAAIPVADLYTESVLLPLARLSVTRSHLFSQTENFDRIKADAEQAMQVLGIASPKEEIEREGARKP